MLVKTLISSEVSVCISLHICTGQLAIADLKTVRAAVWEARTEWMNIGIELNIAKTDLDAIKGAGDPGVCLTEMLTLWLKLVDPLPTWSALISALKQPPIGCQQLAEQIETKHVVKWSPCGCCKTLVSSYQGCSS